jgi:hypothetical protein
MPNATCFLLAYVLVLLLEFGRWRPVSSIWDWRLKVALLLAMGVALFTHTLYLLERALIGYRAETSWTAISWHDWAVLASWALGAVYSFLLLRRGNSRIGIFVLPIVLLLTGGAIALPPEVGVHPDSAASAWRFAHGLGMAAGTVLVSLGFSMGAMYFLHSSRLKSKRPLQSRFPLPSLEYLQSSGRFCLIGSAISIGFGMVAGVIMNLTRDGRVEWMDRGILFSAGLFVWLTIASLTQWFLARRGSGHAIAWMNILSFWIVAVAVLLVLSTPHGGNKPGYREILDQSEGHSAPARREQPDGIP